MKEQFIFEITPAGINKIKNLEYFGAINNKNYFYINLQITMKCNFDCYYCSDLHNNKLSDFEFNYDNFKILFDEIRKQTKKPIYLWVYGGEPFLYSKFDIFINKITDLLNKDDKLELVSNFSFPFDYYKKFAIKYKNKNVIITGSFHNTQNKDFYDYLKKALMFDSFNMLNCATIMLNSKLDDFEKYYNLGYCIKDHLNFSPLISPTINGTPPEKFGKDPLYELNYINKINNIEKYKLYSYEFSKSLKYKLINNDTIFYTSKYEMWVNNCNNFSGMFCNVGKERITMEYTGTFFTCFNEIYSKERNSIFNINDLDFKNKVKEYFKELRPYLCKYNNCVFDFEHLKFRKEDEKSIR